MARGDLNASQLGGAARGAAMSDRDMEQAIFRVLTTKMGLNERMVQDLQALMGQRFEPGSSLRPKAAVRRGDLSVIRDMPELRAKEASGSVTLQDYNDLRQDVRRVYEALSAIAKAVGRD